ncbi:8-oxo-dGTP pyrophosphatase MutT, NUDIX family [Filimonas lacunae]|uniref:GDP-mannose pyrophosphatase n=1 Tax=Filimonas lacunae TaxID=477680 RepID=A0A173MDN0_9BACT|nr:NUDIX hydrolase [Filimonas lacunae]BAV05703.1 ADP-ribose pyrophosphatase [Filimonas lacunae]SIT28846.1 8-oxo-dGTP pyrophosphatase MutT, NUDIX family [Filimonas lacunae]
MSDTALNWKTLSSEYVYKDNWLTARKDKCETPDGKIIEDYYVLEYTDWATALPITEDGKIILVKQYRHALGETSIELPGGCIDDTDATIEDGIRRELLEETGYAFEKVHYLGRTSANPSTNANLMHTFVATGGKKVQDQHLDANEQIEIMEVSWEEFLQLVDEKRIVQSMHMTAIFYALRYLDKIKFV